MPAAQEFRIDADPAEQFATFPGASADNDQTTMNFVDAFDEPAPAPRDHGEYEVTRFPESNFYEITSPPPGAPADENAEEASESPRASGPGFFEPDFDSIDHYSAHPEAEPEEEPALDADTKPAPDDRIDLATERSARRRDTGRPKVRFDRRGNPTIGRNWPQIAAISVAVLFILGAAGTVAVYYARHHTSVDDLILGQAMPVSAAATGAGLASPDGTPAGGLHVNALVPPTNPEATAPPLPLPPQPIELNMPASSSELSAKAAVGEPNGERAGQIEVIERRLLALEESLGQLQAISGTTVELIERLTAAERAVISVRSELAALDGIPATVEKLRGDLGALSTRVKSIKPTQASSKPSTHSSSSAAQKTEPKAPTVPRYLQDLAAYQISAISTDMIAVEDLRNPGADPSVLRVGDSWAGHRITAIDPLAGLVATDSGPVRVH